MTTVAIHQPDYLPWLGYFSKMKAADVFILYDTAQYTKNGFGNRNKIRTKDGWAYLTIPVEKEYHFQPIVEVRLPRDDRWRKKHWAAITANYARAPYLEGYQKELEQIYVQEKFERLVDINVRLIEFVRKTLGIETKLVKSSELEWGKEKKATDALVAMVEAVGGGTYLSGKGGSAEYLEQEKFTKVKLQWHGFEHPTYRQAFPGFEPGMAAIDALFNLGEKAKQLI